jgi:hypothetical protein
MVVVNAIHGWNMGIFGHVIAKIKDEARLRRKNSFRYENRKSNVDAHLLARFATSLSIGRHVWFLASPDGLNIHVNFDST